MCDIEDVISSRGRIKILKLLAETEGLTVYKIAKLIGMSGSHIKENLKVLSEADIIVPKFVGSARLFIFNPEGARAMHVKQFFSDWKKLEAKTK